MGGTGDDRFVDATCRTLDGSAQARRAE